MAEKTIEAPIRVLLIESRNTFASLIKTMLITSNVLFELEWAATLSEAMPFLKEKEFDVVLADIMLGDAGGHEIIQQLMVQCTTLPIIALMETSCLSTGKEILSHGAQDYISVRELSIDSLVKTIFYAIEREKLTENLKGLSMQDDLTALYNRRGFRNLAEQQLRITERTHRMCSLIYIDLDNLKVINDSTGHNTGDEAIRETADILREILRNTDIIGRLGGDEFIVLAPDTSETHVQLVLQRLRARFARRNTNEAVYQLSASIGHVSYKGGNPLTLDDLQAQAEEKMYSEKKGKKEAR